MESQSNFNILTQKILEIINGKSITPSNILNIITHTMSIIDTNTSLKNYDKKQMCMNIIYNLLESNNSIEYPRVIDKDFILQLLNNLFDSFIETIIGVSKGSFDINKIEKNTISCFKMICNKVKK